MFTPCVLIKLHDTWSGFAPMKLFHLRNAPANTHRLNLSTGTCSLCAFTCWRRTAWWSPSFKVKTLQLLWVRCRLASFVPTSCVNSEFMWWMWVMWVAFFPSVVTHGGFVIMLNSCVSHCSHQQCSQESPGAHIVVDQIYDESCHPKPNWKESFA